MAYFFTLLYILTAYVTPQTLFGELGLYHPEIVIAGLAVVFSLPNLLESKVMATRQTFALTAFACANFLSVALTGWLMGGVIALYQFMPPAFGFLLVAVNCKRKWHLQILVLALFLSSTCFILLALRDLHDGVLVSPYLFGEGDLRRIRGVGFVNDPNDLAQAMVSLVPAIFLWKGPRLLSNIFLVGLPLAVMLVGLYLTHSRGAIVALAAVVLISARRKLGTLPAGILAGVLFAASLAVGWSGGREVSMESGADRLDLWAAGLQLIKAHPLFGVGIGGFADANGITAHNSVVICAAETGIVGLFFWTMFLFCSFRQGVLYDNAATAALPAKAEEPVGGGLVREPLAIRRDPSPVSRFRWNTPRFSSTAQAAGATFARTPVAANASAHLILPGGPSITSGMRTAQAKELSASDVRGMNRILIASLTGFLTAGWFLSRAYSMWLFMFCGMLYAGCQMGAQIGLVPLKDSQSFTLRWSLAVTFGLLMLISIILRLRSFGH